MKEEQFLEAKEILKKIDEAKSKLDKLNLGYCQLVFNDNTYFSYEELIDMGVTRIIRSALELEISTLEAEFEKL